MEIPILIISLILIAFFSGIEIAFVSSNKLRVELLKEKSGSAKIVSEFNANPSRFISTMLIGLNIGLVLFGSTMSSLLEKESEIYSFIPKDKASQMLLETLLTTCIVLLLGELIPKLLFRINADQMLLTFAYPTKYLFYIPLKPLTDIFHKLSKSIIKLFVGKDYNEGKQAFTEVDLEYLIKESAIEEGSEEDSDNLNSEIFERALYLKEEKVRNCMVPRLEIESVNVKDSIEDLKNKFLESKHSRLLVYEEHIDKILGYVHHFDLLKKPTEIRPIIRSIDAVPTSMNAQDLLVQFIKGRKNMAWVIDEYGGTAGIITLEDIIEEIFGEIEDEHDVEEFTEKKLAENEFIFTSRLEVDYLNEAYNLRIPMGDYETLAGYIVTNHEEIPDKDEVVLIHHFEVKILKASENRIELVQLKVLPEN